MRIKSFLVALLTISIFLGCKKKEEDKRLTVTMNKSATALPVSIQSCSDIVAGDPTVKSLSAASVKLSRVQMSVQNTNDPVEISYLIIEMRSGGLEGGYQKIIYDDFEATMGVTSPIVPANGTTYSSSCEVRLGGIKFVDPSKDAFVSTTVTVVGHTIGNEEELVTATADIEIKYQGVR